MFKNKIDVYVIHDKKDLINFKIKDKTIKLYLLDHNTLEYNYTTAVVIVRGNVIVGYSFIVDVCKMSEDKYRYIPSVYNIYPTSNEIVILNDIYISSAFRNRGYGKTLVQDIFMRYCNTTIMLHPENQQIIGFWGKFGFKVNTVKDNKVFDMILYNN